MANKTKVDNIDYLCFTANTDNSSVRLNKAGTDTHNTISLVYSVDNGKTWSNYEWGNDLSDPMLGDLITLAHAGDKVYFKAPNGIVNYNFSKSTAYYNFGMSGSIGASGNIMSIVSEDMPNTIPSRSYFMFLFYNCAALSSAPTLSATALADSCYREMFRGCTSISSAPLLTATTLKQYCYYSMFYGCTNLRGIPEILATSISDGSQAMRYIFYNCSSLEGVKIHFTAWDLTDGATNYTYAWLPNNKGAVFQCPSTLDTSVARSATTIPSNWTVKKKGYYSTNKFYNDAELTTESVLTQGEYYIDIPTKDEYYYNGTNLVLWGGQLPNGYTLLDYIETDGNQYINTSYVGTSPNIEIITKATILGAISTEQGIISNFSVSSQYERISLGFTSRKLWFLYSRSYANPADARADIIVGNPPKEAIIRAVLDSATETKQLTVNGVTQVAPYTCKSASSVAYKLMSRGDSSATVGVRYGFIGRLYYLVLKEDGEVKVHSLPCHDTTNDVNGVYDLKRNAFYPLITVTT